MRFRTVILILVDSSCVKFSGSLILTRPISNELQIMATFTCVKIVTTASLSTGKVLDSRLKGPIRSATGS